MAAVAAVVSSHGNFDEYAPLDNWMLDGEESPQSSLRRPSGASHEHYRDCDQESETSDLEVLSAVDQSLLERIKSSVRTALDNPDSSSFAFSAHALIMVCIVLSTIAAVMETVQELHKAYNEWFTTSEVVFTMAFTVEILLRAFSASCLRSYLTNCANVVDIVATSPWYAELLLKHMAPAGISQEAVSEMAGSLRTLRVVRLVRMVRLLRVLRLAKAARHSETLTTVLASLGESLQGAYVLVALVGMGALLGATAIYAVESDNHHGGFRSIPAALWWSMATITTVGYGDVVPKTTAGKMVGIVTMVVGMLIVSVSVAVITTSFTEHYQNRMQKMKVLKRCLKTNGNQSSAPQDAPTANFDRNAHSFRSMVGHAIEQQSDEDLAVTFARLEKETQQALKRLESEVLAMKELRVQRQSAAAAERMLRKGANGTQALSVDVNTVVESQTEVALLALDVLQDQHQNIFRHAASLAVHVASQAKELEQQSELELVGRTTTATTPPQKRSGTTKPDLSFEMFTPLSNAGNSFREFGKMLSTAGRSDRGPQGP